MIVPGLSPGGFMIQRFRSSGPLLGTAPPAMVGREATPGVLPFGPRFGPMVPVAPAMPGMVWHPPHPFWAISAAPSAGEAPPGAGGGTVATGFGRGDAMTPGDGTDAGDATTAGDAAGLTATPGEGTTDAAGATLGCGA